MMVDLMVRKIQPQHSNENKMNKNGRSYGKKAELFKTK